MTSKKKAKANRRNARASTGPRTVSGRAIASRNSTKHGLLSRLEVLPHVETVSEWEEHLSRTLEDLHPSGYLERVLAERVAVNLWRLRRVVRFERDAAAVVLEKTGHADADTDPALRALLRRSHGTIQDIRKAEERLAWAERVAAFVRRLSGLPDGEKVDAELAAFLVETVADDAGVNLFDVPGDPESGTSPAKPDLALPDYPDGVDLDEVEWDAVHLRKVLAAIADHVGRPLPELLAPRDVEAANARAEVENERAELERTRRRAALADPEELEKVNRYEVSIERSLFRNLHELQRLQASRAGKAVAPPAVLDVDVEGGSTHAAGAG